MKICKLDIHEADCSGNHHILYLRIKLLIYLHEGMVREVSV